MALRRRPATWIRRSSRLQQASRSPTGTGGRAAATRSAAAAAAAALRKRQRRPPLPPAVRLNLQQRAPQAAPSLTLGPLRSPWSRTRLTPPPSCSRVRPQTSSSSNPALLSLRTTAGAPQGTDAGPPLDTPMFAFLPLSECASFLSGEVTGLFYRQTLFIKHVQTHPGFSSFSSLNRILCNNTLPLKSDQSSSVKFSSFGCIKP